MEGWKNGRVEGWKGGRLRRAVTTVPSVRVFSLLPVKGLMGGTGQISEVNSVFCFLTSVLAVRLEFEFDEYDLRSSGESGER
jgi:hypothetical protein